MADTAIRRSSAVMLEPRAPRQPSPATETAAPDLDSWRGWAACHGMDTEAFYDPDQVDDAKAVCTSCPVRTPCLATALLHRKQHGVRGGLSEEERRRLITRIRRMVA